MRAVSFSAFGGPDVLEVLDVSVPDPGAGRIRIRVGAVGVNPYDAKLRAGQMGGEPPRRVGLEVAGVVDALGDGVDDVRVGEQVFGFAIGGGAADFCLSSHYARTPASLTMTQAAALPVAVETAWRGLDLLGVGAGETLLVNGASGAVGQSVLQLAALRGARIIGTASERSFNRVRQLGAEPVTYGSGLVDRVRALGVSGVDAAFDTAGGGALPDLIELAGGTERVITIADFAGAEALGVTFSGATSAWQALEGVAELIDAGRFRLPVARVLPLEQIGEAQEIVASGHAGGKVVLTLE